jgi:nucleoside-diphosphate-sugar epimerase
MPMKVLLTGAAGRLGREVFKALVDGGLDVRATDRTFRRDLPGRLEVANLLDGPTCYRLLEDCQAVVHLANHPHIFVRLPFQDVYAQNMAMDVNIFQAAAEMGIKKIVFASSVQAMSGDRHVDFRPDDGAAVIPPTCLTYLPIDGDAPACPRNLYALSKEAGEQMLRYYAALDGELSASAVRFPLIVTQDTSDWFRRRGNEYRDAGRIHGDADEGFSYLFVADAAALVVAILNKQPAGYHQLFPVAADRMTSAPLPLLIEKLYPNVPLRVPASELTSLVDISKITAALGWTPKVSGLVG